MVAALGSTATTSSEIVDSRDKAVYDAIQAGLDRANEEAMARPQRVRACWGEGAIYCMEGLQLPKCPV